MSRVLLSIDLPVRVDCPTCYGTGIYPGNDRGEDCPTCKGAGTWSTRVQLDRDALDRLAEALVDVHGSMA